MDMISRNDILVWLKIMIIFQHKMKILAKFADFKIFIFNQ
jgi:hypothetical protein